MLQPDEGPGPRDPGRVKAPILLIEDDEDTSASVLELLTEEGFTAKRVLAAVEAIALLRTEVFSLVLTDYMFGRPNDEQALLKAAAGTPVGCLTAWKDLHPSVRDRYAFVLLKPFASEDFLAAVAQCSALQDGDPLRSRVIGMYFQALSRADWDGLVALCTETVRYHLPGTDPLSTVLSGRAAFRKYAVETFSRFPGAAFIPGNVSWLPRGAVASYRSRWNLENGQTAESAGVVHFQFEGAMISEIGIRLDLTRLRGIWGT